MQEAPIKNKSSYTVNNIYSKVHMPIIAKTFKTYWCILILCPVNDDNLFSV